VYTVNSVLLSNYLSALLLRLNSSKSLMAMLIFIFYV
jgi:hypothetical protein